MLEPDKGEPVASREEKERRKRETWASKWVDALLDPASGSDTAVEHHKLFEKRRTIHRDFLMRGMMNYGAEWLHDTWRIWVSWTDWTAAEDTEQSTTWPKLIYGEVDVAERRDLAKPSAALRAAQAFVGIQ